MRIAYANAAYRPDSSSGKNAHIWQFITNAVALGHEVWGWRGNQHPAVQCLPETKIGRLITLRTMDAIYVRIEDKVPISGFSRWAVTPYKELIGSPIIVWEFNTVPDFGLVLGRRQADIQQAIQDFQSYSQGCDLAICVSQSLVDYVRDDLGFKRVLVVPNGSDPELFHPDTPPVKRVQRNPNQLNVVWIGSANLAWHNFDLLREAAQLLWQRDKSDMISFHILGSAHSLMHDMPPNVNYYGSEDYNRLPSWLSAMDVGLCLYHPGAADYSSPLKVFDYMASGLTVVGTSQPQLCEIFDKLGQSDLLVPANDAVALADVLSKLAWNRERVRYQGEVSRKLVIKFYNWRRAVQDTFDEIESLLQHRQLRNN
ncbi:glycosyltransferase [Coleofasciculus chthonoplastes]|uniref:glycosyltransferase n=1 Tax=Coleofasciculus chthonoplastes TaxID=64178 RepID=UPI0033051A8D